MHTVTVDTDWIRLIDAFSKPLAERVSALIRTSDVVAVVIIDRVDGSGYVKVSLHLRNGEQFKGWISEALIA